MSKKKSFSGSTMTLKDFHGGSIPSDIPLPSAPGVIVRPADRPGYDRPTAWGNSTGRLDHRLRPNSSGSMRNLDDKTPFLSNTAHIGRNFDEDERRPLDTPSGPRRTVSDESIRAPVVRSETKGDVGRFAGQQSIGPLVPPVGPVNPSSYSARVVEGGHSAVSSRPLSGGGSGGGDGGASYSNAWGVRKEAGVVTEMASSPWTGQSTVSKFAQASALDKISSGRWQTKPTHPQAGMEVIRPSEPSNNLYGRVNDSYYVNFTGEGDYCGDTLVRHRERGFSLEEGILGGVKEMPGVERVQSPVLLDGNERTSVLYTNDGQRVYPDGKWGASELHLASEVTERPKLKLLPRMKPLDVSEASTAHYKKPVDTSLSGTGGNILVKASPVQPGLTSDEASELHSAPISSEAGNRLVERPKLNLKPRSQPLDQSEGRTEKERMGLFGGARPRETVLKERGADDVVTSHDEVQASSRIRSDILQPEMAPLPANFSRHTERMENLPNDHRTGRGNERREQRADVQKVDTQRKNWRNENWRNRETEKHHQQERQSSPETWRKPVDLPKPANPDGSGMRFGKAVSAVELAQAFSKPVSDPKPVDQFSGQRGVPGRSQIPFSRLMAPGTRPRINGY